MHARALLTEAGYPDGFELGLMTAGRSDLIRASEIVHQNLSQVGIEMKILQSSAIVDEFFRARRGELTLVSWSRSGLQKITRMFGPHSVANIGHISVPQIDRLAAQLGGMAPGVRLDGERNLGDHRVHLGPRLPPGFPGFRADRHR